MTSGEIGIDFESRSTVDLTKSGVHKYAESPDTHLWCAAFALDDGPVRLWYPGQPCPALIQEHVARGGLFRAFNAQFERVMWNHILGPRHGWPEPSMETWRCTMAMANAQSLPGSLEKAAMAMGIVDGKDLEGAGLMRRMMRPRRPRKGEDPEGIYYFDEPERIERLGLYCMQDVVVERTLANNLLSLRPSEQKVWELDQRINDRGAFVDVDLCHAALKVVETAAHWLDQELYEVTDGEVPKASNVQKLGKWLASRGIETEKLDKKALAVILMRADLPADVRRAVEIRREAAKASVKKIKALLTGRSADGKARGLYGYHKAGTGRWASFRFQAQNLKTPHEDRDIAAAIDSIMPGSADFVRMVEGDPLEVVGDCIRGMVKAPDGKKLTAGDFTSIEGVVLPWLAGEQWKLDAFKDYIAGRAPDLYIQSYAKTFHVSYFPKTDVRRKFGKVMELASGFQGSHGAYLRMGATGPLLDRLVEIVKETTDFGVWDEISERYNGAFGLTLDQWTALKIAIENWRAAHPEIKSFWYDLETAAFGAVANRGQTFPCRKVAFRAAGSFLYMRLPSGRALSYPYPRIESRMMPWGKKKDVVVYMGEDTYTKKWSEQYAYGGLWAENATQATARDVQAEAMLRIDPIYPIIMHTHDEIVSETADDFGSLEEFEKLMVVLPTWASGLPLAASGFCAKRYRK